MSRTICAVPVRLSSIALSKLLKLVWCDEWKQKYTCLCKERSETKVLFTILLWVFAGRHMVFFSLNRRSHRESGIACCWNLPKLLLRSRHLLRLQNCQKRMSYSVKRVFRLVWRPAFHGQFGAFGVVYVHTSKLAAKGFVCCFVLKKTPKKGHFLHLCLSFVVRFLSGNGCGCSGDWTAGLRKVDWKCVWQPSLTSAFSHAAHTHNCHQKRWLDGSCK